MTSPVGQEPDGVVLTGSGAPPRLPGPGLVATHRPRTGREWVAVVRGGIAESEELVARVRSAGASVQRAALARVQPGLDRWAPSGSGRRAIGIVEYVHSDPAARAAYYRSQYEVSGPSMRDLWGRGLVQRFVGVEVLADLVPAPEGSTAWDVLHLTEFPVAALPRMLSWTRLFDAHARAAGHASMAELKRGWGSQRTMVKGRARIAEIAG